MPEKMGKLNEPIFADALRSGLLKSLTCRWCKGVMALTPRGALLCTTTPSCDGKEHMPNA